MKIIRLESERIIQKTELATRTGTEVTFQGSVTINRPVSELYAFWRNLENLPSFMKHLESVTVMDGQSSYWVLRNSEDQLWAWSVEITEDRQNEIVAWRSIDDAAIQTAGSVRFSAAPGNHGTALNLTLKCLRPVGKFRAAIVTIFEQDVQRSIGGDLSRLKILLEWQDALMEMGRSGGAVLPIGPWAAAGRHTR